MPRDVGRREFLATASAAGLTLWFGIPGGVPTAGAVAAFEPNAWLTITRDGVITVHITKAEMGQGIGTAFAQIVAEELEADCTPSSRRIPPSGGSPSSTSSDAIRSARSVAPGFTFFALEAFLDELAHLAKVDPLQMRLAMLKNRPRLTHVLTLAAARAGWETRLPTNVGRGRRRSCRRASIRLRVRSSSRRSPASSTAAS